MGLDRAKPWDIRERAFKYAVRAVHLFRVVQDSKDRAGWILAKQYLRSATSIGANLEEGRAAESRADFVHKCRIALKEARESVYWLLLLRDSGVLPEARLSPLIDETDELIAIVTRIIVSTKKTPSLD